MTSSTPLSLKKKIAFAMVSVLLFFTLLECILVVCGLAPLIRQDDPFVGFSSSIPLYVNDADSTSSGMLVTAPNRRTHFNIQRFSRNKPANTFRVFCLGGSTTYGRPFDDVTSFPGWLREMLPVADPNRSWEVINAGGVSYASYRIAAVVQELVHYQPDLFVIYAGHNEFLEKRTYPRLSEMSPLLTRAAGTASHLRTYSLVHKLLSRPSTPPFDAYPMSAEVDEILNHTVGPSSYQRDDRLREQITNHFSYNLQRIVQLARSCGAEVLIISPASNLKDCSPFKSQHQDTLGNSDKKRFDNFLEAARPLQLQGKIDEAIIQCEQALAIDDRHAGLHYQLGRLLLAANRQEQALAASERALEEDICPLRAPSAIREACKQVTQTGNVPFVDFHHLLQQQCMRENQHGLPGQEYFLDHVHLRPAVHRQLAIHIVSQMIASRLIGSEKFWQERDLTAVDQRIYGRVDQVTHATALRNVAKVLNWAGKHLEAGSLALESLETLPRDAEALLLSAPYLKTLGRLDEAAEHYRQALVQLPDHVEAHKLLGALLAENMQYDEARKHFREVLRINPGDWQAHLRVGILSAQLQQFKESLPHYQAALRQAPNEALVHFHYGISLAHAGQVPKAIREYRQAISLDPHQADAFFNLATLLEKTAPAQARSCYQEAIRINPYDMTAFYRLGLLCERENPSAAAGHYRQALKINPGFLPAQTRLQQLLKQRPSGIPD